MTQLNRREFLIMLGLSGIELSPLGNLLRIPPEQLPTQDGISDKLTIDYYLNRSAFWNDIEIPDSNGLTPKNAPEYAVLLEEFPVICLPNNIGIQLQNAASTGLDRNKVLVVSDSFLKTNGLGGVTNILEPLTELPQDVAEIYTEVPNANALNPIHTYFHFADIPRIANDIENEQAMHLVTNLIDNIYSTPEENLELVNAVRETSAIITMIINPWISHPMLPLSNGITVTPVEDTLSALELAKNNNLMAINMWPILRDPLFEEGNILWRYRLTDVVHPNGDAQRTCVENMISWDHPHTPSRINDPLDCTGRYNTAIEVDFSIRATISMLNELLRQINTQMPIP